MWLVLLVACGGGEAVDGVVWGGFTYRWDMLSHRISYLEAVAEPDGSASLGLVGGDWSTGETFTDAPEYRMRMSRVSSSAWAIYQGETEAIVGPDGVLSASELVDDPAVLAFPNQVVLLRGFALDTDVAQTEDYPEDYDPAYGYTSRGFAFEVGEPTVSGEGLSFDVDGLVRWAVQDRDDMNAAIPYASTGVRVAWTVIGFDGASQSQDFSASVTYPHEAPYSAQPPFGADDLPLSLGGETAAGVAGLRRLDLLVDAQDGSEEGDYLRSFGLELVPEGEDPGAFEGYARGEITNSSLIEAAAISSTVSGTATWVGLDDRRARVDPLVLVGAHAVGSFSVAAPEGW